MISTALKDSFKLTFLSPLFLLRLSGLWFPVHLAIILWSDYRDQFDWLDGLSVSFILPIAILYTIGIHALAVAIHWQVLSQTPLQKILIFVKGVNLWRYFIIALLLLLPILIINSSENDFFYNTMILGLPDNHALYGIEYWIFINFTIIFALVVFGLALPSIATNRLIGVRKWLSWSLKRLPQLFLVSLIVAFSFAVPITCAENLYYNSQNESIEFLAAVAWAIILWFNMIFEVAVLSHVYKYLAQDHPPTDSGFATRLNNGATDTSAT